MAVDGISSNSSLYFSAAQMASLSSSKSQEKKETDKIRKKSFSNLLEKTQKEQSLIQEGFPVEIAEMDIEEAAIFLRDAADIAGNELEKDFSPDAFAKYKKTVSQFLRYMEKNNFQVIRKEVQGFTRKGNPKPPRIQVRIINEKLDEMARYMLSSHKDKLLMVSKLNEIKGLLVDLLAV